MSHIPASQVSILRGDSSITVPILTVNCFLQPLHFQRQYLASQVGSIVPQRGQATPFGQRALVISAWARTGSEKYLIASCRVCGVDCSWLMMIQVYHRSPGLSS